MPTLPRTRRPAQAGSNIIANNNATRLTLIKRMTEIVL
jgi:hypothetical protein